MKKVSIEGNISNRNKYSSSQSHHINDYTALFHIRLSSESVLYKISYTLPIN